MAIYEYRCPGCGSEFETQHPMSKADEPTPCPRCGAAAQRLPSIFAASGRGKMRVPSGSAFRGDEHRSA